MKFSHLLAIVLHLLASTIMTAQDNDFYYLPFKGEVFQLPASKKIGEVYRKSTSKYKKIGEIELTELNIPEQTEAIPFPQVSKKHLFGIFFNSELIINKADTYRFELASDDGSVLWLDNKILIDNDGIHTMTSMTQSMFLDKGKYPIKLWYYNGVPDKYGLQFFTKLAFGAEQKIISINSEELKFKYNSAKIEPSYFNTLNELADRIKDMSNIHEIRIIGHTDSTGSASFNQKLSYDRASEVKKHLRNKINNDNITYLIVGKGESEPIASNEEEKGKSQNRRVEIIIN